MNKKLGQREREGKVIKCDTVGAGQMGRGIVIQMVLMKGIASAAVSDIDLELVVHAFEYVGIKDVDVVHTNEIAEADKAVDEGEYITITNSNPIPQCRPIEVATGVTGIPDVEAKVATDATNNKKHVVMLNVEADMVIGPLLGKMAKDNGIIYTGGVGDEPGIVVKLYDLATTMDLEIKVVGKGENNRINKNCDPGIILEGATKRKMSPEMLRTFKGGAKTMVEMTAMSNVTDLVPGVIGEHGTASDVKSLNETYRLKEDGDTPKRHGVVEYVNGVALDASVTVAIDDEETAYQMRYHSMGPESLWALYRPYRLYNPEAPLTAARAVIDGESTIVPKNGLVSECITVTRIDLRVGRTIDDIGGCTTYGSICKHEEAEGKGYAPYSLVNHKTVMKRDVKKGELIIYDDTELDTATLIYKLCQKQDETFG